MQFVFGTVANFAKIEPADVSCNIPITNERHDNFAEKDAIFIEKKNQTKEDERRRFLKSSIIRDNPVLMIPPAITNNSNDNATLKYRNDYTMHGGKTRQQWRECVLVYGKAESS